MTPTTSTVESLRQQRLDYLAQQQRQPNGNPTLEYDQDDCPRELHLLLTNDTKWEELGKEILHHWHSVRELVIEANNQDWRNDRNDESILHFFGILGSLPKVKSIQLQNMQQGLPLSLLISLISDPNRWRRLKSLEVTNVHVLLDSDSLYGEAAIWDFVSTLMHLRRLRHLSWTQWMPATTEPSASPPKSVFRREVLEAILKLPKLESLVLQGSGPLSQTTTYTLGDIPADALGKLCQSQRLEELTLKNFVLDTKTLKNLGSVLRYNFSLRLLELDVSHAPAAAVWNALKINQSITTLHIWFCYGESQNFAHLAKCLACNTTLLEVTLQSYESPSQGNSNRPRFREEDARAFVTMLESNRFSPITLQLDDYNPLPQMESNHNVKKMLLKKDQVVAANKTNISNTPSPVNNKRCHGHYASLINLHTYMNVEGGSRAALFVQNPEAVPPQMWMRLLTVAASAEKPVSSVYRIDALFQLLQQHPALCVGAGGGKKSDNDKENKEVEPLLSAEGDWKEYGKQDCDCMYDHTLHHSSKACSHNEEPKQPRKNISDLHIPECGKISEAETAPSLHSTCCKKNSHQMDCLDSPNTTVHVPGYLDLTMRIQEYLEMNLLDDDLDLQLVDSCAVSTGSKLELESTHDGSDAGLDSDVEWEEDGLELSLLV